MVSRDTLGEFESAKKCCPLAALSRTRLELERLHLRGQEAELPALAIKLPGQAFEQLLGLILKGLLTSAREMPLPVGAGDEVTRGQGVVGAVD